MTEQSWLDKLKEGDTVISDGRAVMVTRTTGTRVFVGGTAYRRADGGMVGQHGYRVTLIEKATPEAIARCNHLARVDYLLAYHGWRKLSVELVAEIYEKVKA